MKVLDIMTPNVVTIHKTDSLATAVKLMDDTHTRHLAVTTATGDLVGIVSDRDCRLAMQSPFAFYSQEEATNFANHISVQHIMTPMPYCVGTTASIAEAAQIMLEHKISALPVMQDKTMIGIVTSTDLLKLLVTANV